MIFTAHIRIVRKKIIDTVYVIMYDQHINPPLIWKNAVLDALISTFLISNIQNIGINHLFLLHLSFNFTICPIFTCEFIFLLIVFLIDWVM